MAYKFMNFPLRDEKRREKGDPCPLPVTTAYAEEGIKKLRKLNAPDESKSAGDVGWSDGSSVTRKMNKTELFRGMKKTRATDDFLEQGGTELAFMSTTTSLEVCQSQPAITK
jgi:hypothetical protein